jgi:hypothetical protein
MAPRAALLAVLLLLACVAASESSSSAAPYDLVACSFQIVVVAPSAALPSPLPPPQRRHNGEPFFDIVLPPSSSSSSPGGLAAVTDLINAMGHTYEAATGRRLFPVRAEFITSAEQERRCEGGSAAASRVSWELSTGRMVVVVSGDASGADNAISATLPLISALARQVAARVAESAAAAAAPSSTTQAPASAAAAVATLGASFAAAAATAVALPLWQCIGCVALLGLLFPLAINAALGAAVDAACAALKLDPTSCFDLSLGALFAGVVLAALSSVPIYALCRLAECGKRGAAFVARSAV